MRRTFIDVLQAFLSYSGHYLCANVIKEYKQVMIDGCVSYEILIENACISSCYETITVDLEDILIFLYLDRK